MKRKGFKRFLAVIMFCVFALTGCSKNSEQVIIYSNADDEAVEAMKNALDSNGYKGEYVLQTFGTSELGGKILAEGNKIEADLITMSSFYLDSAQSQNKMFADLTFDVKTIQEFPSFYAPVTSQEGAIIINTEELSKLKLDAPKSLKELADPKYKDVISVTDVNSSSTAWLLIQALVSEYGDEAKDVLKGIYKNAGSHIEDSGSAPLKKCRAGEVAIGFGLRHQAVRDKDAGLPITFVDPTEGNFSLTESVAVIQKDQSATQKKAMEMAQCIIENGRKELLETYPNALYEGEVSDVAHQSTYPKIYKETLTVELLKEHQKLSDECR